jgi:hypothetical protein
MIFIKRKMQYLSETCFRLSAFCKKTIVQNAMFYKIFTFCGIVTPKIKFLTVFFKVNNPHLSENKISLFGEFADFNIPFPRSSGARFCGDSKLVCFGLTRQYTVKVSHVLGTR